MTKHLFKMPLYFNDPVKFKDLLQKKPLLPTNVG